jgi:hypothetical protein
MHGPYDAFLLPTNLDMRKSKGPHHLLQKVKMGRNSH